MICESKNWSLWSQAQQQIYKKVAEKEKKGGVALV